MLNEVDVAMTAKIDINMTVGEIVVMHPECARVFELLSIDYCCGGKIPLQDACRKAGLDIEPVLQKLSAVLCKPYETSELDWTKSSLKSLIDHIINVYHHPLRLELCRIEALCSKVARVHGETHPYVNELADVFARFKEELELHMQKEEMILFPTIAARETHRTQANFGCGGSIEHPITVMMMEHDSAGETLQKMRELTNSYTAPHGACNTFRAMLHALELFESEMHQHVHKENNILFPRAVELFNTGAEKQSYAVPT